MAHEPLIVADAEQLTRAGFRIDEHLATAFLETLGE